MKGGAVTPPGSIDGVPLAAGDELHRPGDELLDAETGHQVGERQIFAERHEMHLVDGIDDLAAVIDGDDRIVIARPPSAAPSPRFAPRRSSASALRLSMSPMAASASGRSVKRNGTAVSGHRMSCGAGLPASGGCADSSIVVAKMRSRTPSSHFSREVDSRLDDADGELALPGPSGALSRI